MAVSSDTSKRLKRPRYFDRQQLKAADLTLEQTYLDGRLRRLNRFLHGWGVVCGGEISQPEDAGPWSIVVGETFALTPGGDEVYIPPEENPVDLQKLIQDTCGESKPGCEELSGVPADEAEVLGVIFLAAAPALDPCCPEPAYPEDCDHPGNRFQDSRQCETYCLKVLCELPPHYEPLPCRTVREIVCEYSHPVCPPALGVYDDMVILAALLLDGEGIHGVDYSVRKRLLPMELLQRMVECRCEAPPVTTVPPQTTEPPTTTQPPSTPGPAHTTNPPSWTTPPAYTVPPHTLPPHTLPHYTFWTTRFPSEVTRYTTLGPGGVPELDAYTRPVPFDERLIEAVDVLVYDVDKGFHTDIDEMALLSDAEKVALKNAGIRNIMELYAADTGLLKQTLGLSDVKAAEYKANALESVRRANPVRLSNETYDITAGAGMPVEAVMNIGTARGAKLRKNDYASVLDVANASPREIAEITGVSETTAREMVEAAQGMIRR